MIQRYNREQMIFGVLSIIGGLLILLVTWVVLRGICDFLGIIFSTSPRAMASLVISALIVLGFRSWWVRGERYGILRDAEFRASFEPDGQSASHTEQDQQLVAGFRDLFGHVFYIGPRLISNGITRIYARLPLDPDLETRMTSTLERMRVSKKWLPADAYDDEPEEVAALIRLGLIDYSASKSRLKAVTPGSNSPNDPPDDEPSKFAAQNEPLTWRDRKV